MACLVTAHVWRHSDPNQAAKVLDLLKFTWEVLANPNVHTCNVVLRRMKYYGWKCTEFFTSEDINKIATHFQELTLKKILKGNQFTGIKMEFCTMNSRWHLVLPIPGVVEQVFHIPCQGFCQQMYRVKQTLPGLFHICIAFWQTCYSHSTTTTCREGQFLGGRHHVYRINDGLYFFIDIISCCCF